MATERMTRKQKRILRQQGAQEDTVQRNNLSLKHFDPLTANQKLTFQAFNNKNLMLHGMAGTGKSFISLYLSLKEIMKHDTPYKKVVIVRSVVPTRDMGFLPGNNKEKAKVYEAPYYAICTELFGRGDAYEVLKGRGIVDFISTSFIRGITLNDCVIVVDEIANLTLHELDSIITRVGKNCKIVFCGDFSQSDFTRDQDRNGLKDFMRIIHKMKTFDFIEFDENDIVRSAMVKEYIISKHRLGINA